MRLPCSCTTIATGSRARSMRVRFPDDPSGAKSGTIGTVLPRNSFDGNPDSNYADAVR
jgi:hypothetical protein